MFIEVPRRGGSIPSRRTSARTSSLLQPGAVASPSAKNAKANVRVVVKKENADSSVSSPHTATEDSSADGADEFYTPATSAPLTPVDHPSTKPPKRVSASARARELKSSAFCLGGSSSGGASGSNNNKNDGPRGVKRDSSSVVASHKLKKEEATEGDAALAKAMQLEEYQQNPSKKKKKSVGEDEIAAGLLDSDGENNSLAAMHDFYSDESGTDDSTDYTNDLLNDSLSSDSDFEDDYSDAPPPPVQTSASTNRGGRTRRGGSMRGRTSIRDRILTGRSRRVRFFFFFFLNRFSLTDRPC